MPRRVVNFEQLHQTPAESENTRFRLDVDERYGIKEQEKSASPYELHNRSQIRHEQILKAVANLDMTQDSTYRQQLIQWLNEEYAARNGGRLVAIFAKCYLGEPYQDHYVALTGNIIEHFKSFESVPAMFASARGLAANPNYCFVEVYSDGAIVPVREDGSQG